MVLRFPLYSLKTGILAHLAFLIISAMLLINIVMVKFAERDLIQAKIQTGRLLLHTLALQLNSKFSHPNAGMADVVSTPGFERKISELVEAGAFSASLLVNREGAKVFTVGNWDEGEKNAVSVSREALTSETEVIDFYGSTWGVIWLAHKQLNMAAPVSLDGGIRGVSVVSADLTPLYQSLRKSEKFILIYIFLNTMILVLFGIFLLSRTVVKPIHTLLKITEEFKDGEPFPQLVDESRNEIGRLFRSLNIMLKRLEENKSQLESHISSLRRANEEIKKAQDEIVRSEKLASVGRLATGVAHEIGNPIGIVLGYLDLLKKEEVTPEEKNDFLNRMESEITRINEIIRQLLDFSRLTGGEKSETHLHKLILELLDLLKPQPMMADIKIELNLEATGDVVWADPNQLKQAFLNILMNAADAMENDKAADEVSRPRVLTITTRAIENAIELRFADTGPGIPEKVKVHIFDPFYTTKEPGKGTGLGLSVSYRIIEGLGGTIRAESKLGKGTTIVIDIPNQNQVNE